MERGQFKRALLILKHIPEGVSAEMSQIMELP